MTARHTLARSRLRPVAGALAGAATLQAAADIRRRRDPLRGAALPLALAAGWCAVRDAATPRPTLVYTRGLAAQTVGTVLVPPAGLWVIDVTNAGDAGARIVGSSYFGTTVDGRDVEGVDALDLRPLFDPLGVVDERDYRLLRIVPGFGIPVGGSVRVMELPLPVAHRFTRLGLTLTYTGPYGERTAITVEAHPPHGLPGDLLTLDRPADPSPSP